MPTTPMIVRIPNEDVDDVIDVLKLAAREDEPELFYQQLAQAISILRKHQDAAMRRKAVLVAPRRNARRGKQPLSLASGQ